MPRVNLIQVRGGTAAAWTSANPILAAREPGLETDTRKIKYGDGVTAWNSLAYAGGGDDHFKGVYVDDTALTTAYPTAAVGDYAYVDAGVGNPVELWMWDDDDSEWVQGGTGGVVPPADASTPGITKLYTTPDGTNTDGAVSQAGLNSKFRLTHSITGTAASLQAHDNSLLIFNSATPFTFTIDQLTANSKLSFINVGAGAVTLAQGSGVTITGRTTIPAAVGTDFPGGLIFWVSATAVTTVTGEAKEPDVETASTAGGTITFDLELKYQRMFIGSASFATPKTIALDNEDNARCIPFKLEITDIAAVLTFPSSFTMADDRWDDSGHTLTFEVIGKYELSATNYGDGEWILKVYGPVP